MEKINFEAGKQITPAKINEDGTITPAVWEGKTPLTPYVLNLMQTNIENAITENKVTDSSWKDLILTENFVNYNSSTKNMYRKYGNIVEVIGMVKPKTILAKGASTVCFQLPDGYRPEHKVAIICPGSEKNNWLLTINTNGNAEVARYGTTEYIDISTSTCLAYHVSFLVKAGNEINSNLESYGDRIADLEKENNELASNMPWNTTSGKSIHITDSAKYSKNRLSLSGDLEQETTKGLQLYNDTDYFLIGSNVIISDDHYITITRDNTSGTTTAFEEFHTNLSSLIKANTVYTYVVEIKKVSGNGILRINSTSNGKIESQFPASSDISLSSLIAGQVVKIKVTSISEFSNFKKSLRSNIRFSAGESGSITFRLSLLEGDKTSQPFEYEPFTGGKAKPNTNYPSVPIVVTGVQKIKQFGKNIFDVNDKVEGKNHTVKEGDWVTLEKNNTGTSTAFVQLYTKKSSRLKANTQYNIVAEIKAISGKGEIRFVSDYVNNFVSQFSEDAVYNLENLNAGDIIILKRTSKADFTDCVTMLRTYLGVSAGQSGSITLRISVLEDATVTANNFKYEPYWGKVHTLNLGTTQLCAIKENGNVVVKDRAVHRNGKWQWEKNVGKKIINGTTNETERITLRTNTSTTHTKFILANSLPSKIKDALTLTCSHFITKNANDANISENCISSNTIDDYKRYLYISVENKIATTVEELKTYLANNNLTVYYALATPIYEDCTAEQSAVLDKLYNNFELQKGTNNIIVESENGIGVNLELDYMQDNTLKDKKLEDRVTALENLLSTTQTSALLLDNLQNDLESEV